MLRFIVIIKIYYTGALSKIHWNVVVIDNWWLRLRVCGVCSRTINFHALIMCLFILFICNQTQRNFWKVKNLEGLVFYRKSSFKECSTMRSSHKCLRS